MHGFVSHQGRPEKDAENQEKAALAHKEEANFGLNEIKGGRRVLRRKTKKELEDLFGTNDHRKKKKGTE